MKKFLPVSLVFAAGVMVGGYIVSIVLDKVLGSPSVDEIEKSIEEMQQDTSLDEDLEKVLQAEINEALLEEME